MKDLKAELKSIENKLAGNESNRLKTQTKALKNALINIQKAEVAVGKVVRELGNFEELPSELGSVARDIEPLLKNLTRLKEDLIG